MSEIFSMKGVIHSITQGVNSLKGNPSWQLQVIPDGEEFPVLLRTGADARVSYVLSAYKKGDSVELELQGKPLKIIGIERRFEDE